MGKSFKLRFSKVIASFHSCRSKDSSTLPENPVPTHFFSKSSHTKAMTTKLITLDFPVINNSPPSSFKRHVSETMVSVGCGFKSRSQEFKWEKEDKFHVVSSFEDSEGENLALRPPSTPPRFAVEKKKRRVKKANKTKARLRISTSSAEDSGILSTTETWDNYNEEEDETETLVSSSRSFDFSSDDSSTDFNPQLETICETTTVRRRKKRNGNTKRRVKHSRRSFSSSKGRRSSVSTYTSSDSELPARLSVFQKLIPCSVEGKVKESFAIVKKSQDPYEDFKRSMMEMILEKQMFEKNELEQLLQCFLSLNGKHYHGLIVEAFSEIWETLFLGNGNGNDRARNMSTHPRPRTVCRNL